MESNYLNLFLRILNGLNISARLLKKDGSNLSQIDHELSARLYTDFSYEPFCELLKNLLNPGTLLVKTDAFLFSHFFLHVPEEYLPEDAVPCLAIGPFSSRRRSQDDIFHIMEKNGIPAHLFHEISAFYESIPVVESADVLDNIILHFAGNLFNQEYHVEHFPEDNVLFPGSGGLLREVRDNPRLAEEAVSERYALENELMEAVAAGNYERARALSQKTLPIQIRPRAKNPLRNKQHLAIIQNTLFRKAAEAGGVPPLYIDELSTRFALQINEITSLNDLNALTLEMCHKYCLLVQNHAMNGYSPVIKEVISYIDFHYTEDLNLAFLAEKFNIAKTYLSNLFKKETSVTLTDYIHQVRMRRAITLINSSTIPVSAVAAACGYNDINYFIRIFKRTYGLTPKQYQKTVARSSRGND